MTARITFLIILLLPAAGASGQQEQPASLPGAAAPAIFFTDVTDQAGIDFRHSFGDEELSNIVEGTGPGVAFFDYNGDTLPDLYFLNGAWHPDDQRQPEPRPARASWPTPSTATTATARSPTSPRRPASATGATAWAPPRPTTTATAISISTS